MALSSPFWGQRSKTLGRRAGSSWALGESPSPAPSCHPQVAFLSACPPFCLRGCSLWIWGSSSPEWPLLSPCLTLHRKTLFPHRVLTPSPEEGRPREPGVGALGLSQQPHPGSRPACSRVRTFPRDSPLGRDTVRALMHYALKVWSDITPLNFHEVAGSAADIQIDFSKADHNDRYPFDGPGGTVAHAFFPGDHHTAGDTHFDDDEAWTFRSSGASGLSPGDSPAQPGGPDSPQDVAQSHTGLLEGGEAAEASLGIQTAPVCSWERLGSASSGRPHQRALLGSPAWPGSAGLSGLGHGSPCPLTGQGGCPCPKKFAGPTVSVLWPRSSPGGHCSNPDKPEGLHRHLPAQNPPRGRSACEDEPSPVASPPWLTAPSLCPQMPTAWTCSRWPCMSLATPSG